MKSLIKTESSAHFYLPEGIACHEVPTADGKSTRKATLRDARKLGLLPSVTSILKMWPNPGLERYKREQDIVAAITTPRLEGEGDAAFVDRIVLASAEHAKGAADIGSVFHNAMSERLLAGRWPNLPEYQEHFACWNEWIKENLVVTDQSESVLVSKIKDYAGTVDWVGQTFHWGDAVLDFKSQSVKPTKGPSFWDTWIMQLAAYSRCLDGEYSMVSVVLNRDKPESPYVKVWTKDDIEEGWVRFLACLELWWLVNNYHPQNTAA
jgi:hypothetical protein